MALAVEKNSADRRTPYSSSRQTFATAGPHAFLRPKAREEEPSAKNDKWHCQRTEGLLPSDVIPIMLFSERQMSDYKSAALMDDAFPTAKALLAYHGYDAETPTGSAPFWRSAASPPTSPRRPTAKCPSLTTQPSIASVARARTCSAS